MRYLALLLLPALLSAAAPVVSNVRAQQRLGTKLIDITYDLADSDGGTVYISAQLFAGSTALPAFSLSGHIGAGVTPGAGKTIVWNAGQDWNRQYTTSGKVRIIADDISVTPPSVTMAYVPAGFTAGSYGTHGGGRVFTNGFFMDKTEISMATWNTVRTWALANGYTFDNTGLATATDHPVVGVSWYDAVKWCNARSQKEGLAPVYFTDASRATVYKTGTVIVRGTFCNWSADGYRLPTRAEWSKAAWGGSTSGPYYWPSYYGSGSEILNNSHANIFFNYSQRCTMWDMFATTSSPDRTPFSQGNYGTTPVGYYNGNQDIGGLADGVSVNDMKNGFGLYDMAGNAAEWLWDSYYSEVAATTEYLDDNYKGPDLGLGTERYYASGRIDAAFNVWDYQLEASATSAGPEKIIFNSYWTDVQYTNGYALVSKSATQVGLRTVRGR